MTSRPSSSLNKELCILCKKLPDLADSYKCDLRAHIVCNSCFKQKLKNNLVVADRCPNCDSVLIKIFSGGKVPIKKLLDVPTENANSLLNTREETNLEETSETNTNPTPNKIKCPHRPCGKTIYSMKLHYEQDHPDIKTLLFRFGEKLKIKSNVSIIEYGMTYCIAKIQLPHYKTLSEIKKRPNFYNPKRKEPWLFWLLVSGSHQSNISEPYALYWLLTDSKVPFKCTIEMKSDLNKKGRAAVCKVNNIEDDLSISSIQKSLKCLYLTFESIKNLKGLWGNVVLHLTVAKC